MQKCRDCESGKFQEVKPRHHQKSKAILLIVLVTSPTPSSTSTRVVTSVRPKQEFSLSAETEHSAAKKHRIFGFGRIFGTFTYFRPKVNDLLDTHSKIGQIPPKFEYGVPLPGHKHDYMLTNNKQ
jgi:hypothetical protein